jgi:hypothetical protein
VLDEKPVSPMHIRQRLSIAQSISTNLSKNSQVNHKKIKSNHYIGKHVHIVIPFIQLRIDFLDDKKILIEVEK